MEGVHRGTRTTEAVVDLACGCFRVAFHASDIALVCKDIRVLPLRSYHALSGLWIRNLGEGKLLRAAISSTRMSSHTWRRTVSPLFPQKPQSGKRDPFVLISQVKQVSALPYEPPGQIPTRDFCCPLSKKQVWKVLGS